MPKLLLLGRLTQVALQSAHAPVKRMSTVRRRCINEDTMMALYRGVSVLVLLCSATSLVANIFAAGYNVELARVDDARAAACDRRGGDTDLSRALDPEFLGFEVQANLAEAVQSGCEAVALLFITAAYVLLVSLSVSIFRVLQSLLEESNVGKEMTLSEAAHGVPSDRIEDTSAQAAAQSQLRLIAACVVVLVTFPVRAVFDMFYTYSNVTAGSRNLQCGICDTVCWRALCCGS